MAGMTRLVHEECIRKHPPYPIGLIFGEMKILDDSYTGHRS